jgi:hypothetical protein
MSENAADNDISVAPRPARRALWPVILTLVLGFAAVITTLILLEDRRRMDVLYPGCWGSSNLVQCKAEHAARRARGY